VLLDPRVDDPTAFLALDALQTFAFVARHEQQALKSERAKFTIDVLGLDRDVLCETRRVAGRSFESFLSSDVTADASQRRRRTKTDECVLQGSLLVTKRASTVASLCRPRWEFWKTSDAGAGTDTS
jgi:hypothetical protein